MKNIFNSKKMNLGLLIKYAGLLTMTLINMSCNGNNNNSDNNRLNVFQNCATCVGLQNGQSIFQSQSTDITYGMTLNLNFIGTNQFGQQYPQQYGQPQYNNQYPQQNGFGSQIISYAGAVGAQGQLQVNQPIGSGFFGGCFVPAGTYILDTVQAGQWNQAIVSGLVLQASSQQAQMIISIPQAQVAAKVGSQLGQTWNEVPQQGQLFGTLIIQSVNGQNCQIQTTIR